MFWSGGGAGGERRGKNECGEGVNREGITGSALATTSADFGVPVSSGFRDGEMSWAVCPEPQHQLRAGRLHQRCSAEGASTPLHAGSWSTSGCQMRVAPASLEAPEL